MHLRFTYHKTWYFFPFISFDFNCNSFPRRIKTWIFYRKQLLFLHEFFKNAFLIIFNWCMRQKMSSMRGNEEDLWENISCIAFLNLYFKKFQTKKTEKTAFIEKKNTIDDNDDDFVRHQVSCISSNLFWVCSLLWVWHSYNMHLSRRELMRWFRKFETIGIIYHKLKLYYM